MRELAKVQNIKRLYEEEYAKLEAELEKSYQLLAARTERGPVSIEHFQVQANFEVLIREKLRFLHNKIEKVNVLIEKHRQELIEASIEKKVMENLKAKFVLGEQQKERKLEQDFYNEIAIQRFSASRNKET